MEIYDNIPQLGCGFVCSGISQEDPTEDFVIGDTTLVRYNGTDSHVVIPDGITKIGSYAFADCKNITEIVIPESVTSIGRYAFNNCESLTALKIPDNVTSIEKYAFFKCRALTSLTIPNNVTSIGYGAFCACDGLTEIIIPDGITSVADFMFSGCGNLTNIILPDSITNIGMYAFSTCRNLTNIKIPESVTSIGDYAFLNCYNLTDITFPANVTSLGGYIFTSADSLKSITFESVVPPSFNPNPSYMPQGQEAKLMQYVTKLPTIYVPAGSKAAYQAEPFLSGYDIVEVLEITDIDSLIDSFISTLDIEPEGIEADLREAVSALVYNNPVYTPEEMLDLFSKSFRGVKYIPSAYAYFNMVDKYMTIGDSTLKHNPLSWTLAHELAHALSDGNKQTMQIPFYYGRIQAQGKEFRGRINEGLTDVYAFTAMGGKFRTSLYGTFSSTFVKYRSIDAPASYPLEQVATVMFRSALGQENVGKAYFGTAADEDALTEYYESLTGREFSEFVLAAETAVGWAYKYVDIEKNEEDVNNAIQNYMNLILEICELRLSDTESPLTVAEIDELTELSFIVSDSEYMEMYYETLQSFRNEIEPVIAEYHTVSFVNDFLYPEQSIKQGELADEPNPVIPPVGMPYNFIGWFTEDDEPFDFNTPITKDIKLLDKREILPCLYTLSFYSDGELIFESTGENELPNFPENPTKDGYIFDGWILDESSGYTINEPITPDNVGLIYHPPGGNERVNAKWIPISINTIYGDANCDGKVSISDLILLAKYIGGKAGLSEQGMINARCNDGASINGEDLLILIKYLTGEIEFAKDISSYH